MLLKSLLLLEIILLALPIYGTPLGVQRSSTGSIASAHRAQPNHFIKRSVLEKMEAFNAASTLPTGESSKTLRLLPQSHIESSSRDASKGGGTVNKKPTAYRSTWDAAPSSNKATPSRYETILSSRAKYASSGKLELSPEVIDAILGPERKQVPSKTSSIRDNLSDGSGPSTVDRLMKSARRLKNKLSNPSIAEKNPERVKLLSPSTTRGD
ncbi:hypothetical protein MJO29_011036 [Puccinia striiformis f. sp. tritici]|uniref:hypothetical protein n=1 Tax=Puccinia striiformis f. sp. tritici TaxID=168172 RepID=UPI0020089506|nr:hypothetical protein Pst134EA_020947 [Puccinia striiformis f. sp. tritici]KAH9457048.1 hypothetical protein Pst134EA_020947 [Puccinia striiformis f. sp. tritici]KAI7946509.1 hypothetical protein MJO29_011036 [Puccinia striiformis f. sp. tritici]